MTGLTARQLQVWYAGGLLSPTIPSHRTEAGGYTERRYTPIELFELLVLADLRRRGFSVQQLHQILRVLKLQFGQRLFDATGGGGSVHLLTDGRTLYLETSPQQIVDILKNSRQPMFAICLSDTARQVRAVVSGRKRPGRCVPEKTRRIARLNRKARLGS